MQPEDFKALASILSSGGSVSLIGLLFIAWKVWQRFEQILTNMMDADNRRHAELLAGQEAIKRAIIAGNPASAIAFDKPVAG